MMELVLRKYQQEAYNAWLEAEYKGTIKSVTGTGKTFVGIKAILSHPKDWLVIVPTIALAEQWEQKLKEYSVSINRISGKTAYVSSVVNIAVINSLRQKVFTPHSVLIDEVHRMMSKENYKVVSPLLLRSNILALSATPEVEDSERWEHFVKICPIIYDYKIEDALDQGFVSDFEIHLVECPLTDWERQEYERLTAQVKKYMNLYNNDYKQMIARIRERPAQEGMKSIGERKNLLYTSKGKVAVAERIVKYYSDKKIIIFSERINQLDLLMSRVGERALLYHSGRNKKEKKRSLEKFSDKKAGVLLCSKSIDEGLDVPDCDIAIVMSGSQKRRQFIQRLGRILRPQENKKAILFELYVPNSRDEKWVSERRKFLREVNLRSTKTDLNKLFSDKKEEEILGW